MPRTAPLITPQLAFFDDGIESRGISADTPASLLPLVSQLEYLPGVGPVLSDRLKGSGVRDWRQLTRTPWLLPPGVRRKALAAIEGGVEAIKDRDASFFLERLPRKEHWRCAVAFPEKVIYLDIETTGLSRHYHELTCVGWSLNDRDGVTVYWDDDHPMGSAGEHLQQALDHASILVTFNGSHFDVPFLRHKRPELSFPEAHVDLRHFARSAGLAGGQKSLEVELGISRAPSEVSSGEQAPALWFRYQRGDLGALRALLDYNRADVAGLRAILRIIAERRSQTTLDDSHPPSITARGGHLPSAGIPKEVPGDWWHGMAISPYRGQVGPRLRFAELDIRRNIRVVGIDLSGGPKSATGWALVEGSNSHTQALRTDEEIWDVTLSARPDLVSIDAPLSLPAGRLSVSDDDPTRKEFGIMRECERVLKRRGVNTYPALIKSMQGLTARGISLASRLRAEGIPVIESFPGAMQDILGIPRKGISRDHLKGALAEYGLAGAWTTDTVTHDELDALSSAIVGQLFWAGHYEALGNNGEDYLIVPQLTRVERPRVVGLSGATGSGKTTSAEHLESAGYHVVSFRAGLTQLFGIHSVGRRADLQSIGEKLHSEPGGQRRLGKTVIDMFAEHDLVAVDGLRFPEDHSLLRERFGPSFVHIHINCTTPVADQRFLARGGTPEELVAARQSSTEAQLGRLRELADIVVSNDGSKAALDVALSAAISSRKGD